MKVDLHVHTDASDGCDNPRTILEKAASIGLGLIAITDHDSVGNVEQVVKLGPSYGIKVLPAVEISSTKCGKDFHILAYNVDVRNTMLREIISHNNQTLTEKDVDTIIRLQELGWPVSETEYYAYQAPQGIGGWQALNYLKSKGLCQGVNDFFARIYIKENGLGFPTFIKPSEVISAIHGAGGVAILAHAGSSFHGLGLEMPFAVFEDECLDGYECYHPGHGRAIVEALLTHCAQKNMLTTAGSDYHGDFAPGRYLGVPEVYAEQLNLQGILDIGWSQI